MVIQKHPGIEVISGKKNLEVRPAGTNKGELVKRIVSSSAPDFVFCAGDDRTDEDMFRALGMLYRSGAEDTSQCITCVIGPASKSSTARTRLETPVELIRVLHQLANAV